MWRRNDEFLYNLIWIVGLESKIYSKRLFLRGCQGTFYRQRSRPRLCYVLLLEPRRISWSFSLVWSLFIFLPPYGFSCVLGLLNPRVSTFLNSLLYLFSYPSIGLLILFIGSQVWLYGFIDLFIYLPCLSCLEGTSF